MKTALTEKLAATGAPIKDYFGGETASRFGDTASELAALNGGCGVYDLGWRGKILVTGEDRVRWLNGMVTNNINDLQPGHGNYNFVLSAQGRIQADMFAYQRGHHIVVDTDRSQVESLIALLDRFIIMDDVELADATEKLTAIGATGPRALTVLRAAGFDPPEALLTLADSVWNSTGISIVRKTLDPVSTFEIWSAPENAAALWDALVAAGARPVGAESLEMFRVLSGVPKVGPDIRNKDLPQETEQKQAIAFGKGCYIGQEIVERIHARGILHRTFTGFVLDAAAAPGAKVESEGKPVGELTSIVAVPRDGSSTLLGLGYIRREVAAPGVRVKIGDTTATVAPLPFRFQD
ncbi:MAG: folate-binding protein YgfZ [Acidobacteriales bacterium]|nr:folate-binding protein YgfZ [Terriglobales bacterium]